MRYLGKSEFLERLRFQATNSSHFVCLLADLSFYETTNQWVFAFTQIGDVTLIALEPLMPLVGDEEPSHDAFELAWSEFARDVGVTIAAFVLVYGPFAHLLESAGFTAVRVGKEPWVHVDDCRPRGNSGKSVRSARNQAVRDGLTVVEWTGTEIAACEEMRRELDTIYLDWKASRFLHLNGFLYATDLFAWMDERRYFVARSVSRAEAVLIATPVYKSGSYYLEDLFYRRAAPRGVAELLTLEAMMALARAGAREASLGVVLLVDVAPTAPDRLSPLLRMLARVIPNLAQYLYNYKGIELFRKRFRPHRWADVFLAVKPPPDRSPTVAWLKTLGAIVNALEPRLQFSWPDVVTPVRNAVRGPRPAVRVVPPIAAKPTIPTVAVSPPFVERGRPTIDPRAQS